MPRTDHAAPTRALPEIPDLADGAVRERLSPTAIKAVGKLVHIWGLSREETCALIGGVSTSTWNRMKRNPRKHALTQDQLMRASALIGIFKGLRLVLSEPLADRWPTRPNANPIFKGQRPVDSMIKGGIPAMLDTRGHIDAIRGGV